LDNYFLLWSKILGKEKFSPAVKEILDEIMLNMPEVKPGKMFGYPAYYVNKKLAVFIYYDGVVLKLPDELYNKLMSSESSKAKPFSLLNKGKGKNWTIIHHETPEEFEQDFDILGTAVQYIHSLTL
jgi:hypothetical protein